jgi:glycine/D-amino acid oxidase-like deaminating enzyme
MVREGSRLERVVYTADCYIIPREDGRLLVGATVEDVGFRKGATPRGISGAHGRSARRPAHGGGPAAGGDVGRLPANDARRPAHPGCRPLAGGLYYATGHFRNGILLAPVTATVHCGPGHRPAARRSAGAVQAVDRFPRL